MIKALLPQISPTNPYTVQLALDATDSEIQNTIIELEVMKLLSFISNDVAENYPYTVAPDSSIVMHPIFKPLHLVFKSENEADFELATRIGYHKESNSAALIIRDENDKVEDVILVSQDGTRHRHPIILEILKRRTNNDIKK